jgi:hypothetical protein
LKLCIWDWTSTFHQFSDQSYYSVISGLDGFCPVLRFSRPNLPVPANSGFQFSGRRTIGADPAVCSVLTSAALFPLFAKGCRRSGFMNPFQTFLLMGKRRVHLLMEFFMKKGSRSWDRILMLMGGFQMYFTVFNMPFYDCDHFMANYFKNITIINYEKLKRYFAV